jgi:hypothetical protein
MEGPAAICPGAFDRDGALLLAQMGTLYITNWKELWRIDEMPIVGLDWVKNQHMPCTP